MIGCGTGELDFEIRIRPLMEKFLGEMLIPALIHVAWIQAGSPDHRDAKRIKERLNSDTTPMPFDEVCLEIVNVLKHLDEFRIWRKQTVFTCLAYDSPAALIVSSSGRTSARIGTGELVDFRQPLRDHGRTHAGTAPNDRHLSCLTPMFDQLDHVRPIAGSGSASRLGSNPAAAPQVIPLHLSCRPLGSPFGEGSLCTRSAGSPLRRGRSCCGWISTASATPEDPDWETSVC